MGANAANAGTLPAGTRSTTSGDRALGGDRATTTSPQGVQSFVPWTPTSGNVPLAPFEPSNPQLGAGQAAILAEQRALSERLRTEGAAKVQEMKEQEQAKVEDAQTNYDAAWEEHQRLGGVTPAVYDKLTQAQKEQLARQAMGY